VLALDRDQAGQEAVQYLLKRLSVDKIYSVDFGPHKDPNEALMSGYEMSLVDIAHLTPSGAKKLACELLSDLQPSLCPRR